MAEKNVKTVNMMGETLKEQWTNVIKVYRYVLHYNLSSLENTRNRKQVENLKVTMEEALDNMQRLVDEMFTEESEEDTEE